jgi:glycosyltransferase involved in cell wall biosynthesis
VSTPLRVAFDARSLHSPVPRGWDRYTVGLVAALRRREVEVTLLCRSGAPVHPTHVARLGCPVAALPDHGGLWWEQVALPLALRRGRFDLYHAPAEHGVPLISPCPTVLTLHSATVHSYAWLIKSGQLPGEISDYLGYDASPKKLTPANYYWYAQVRRAGHVIAPSAFARDEIVRLVDVGPDRVTTIPLAVDDIFRDPPASEAECTAVLERFGIRRPYLLYVGGYEAHKNVAGLLGAFALVRAQRPDLSLVLVGSGPAGPDLDALGRARGLTPGDTVLFLSGLGPELPTLYDGAALFVSMSWRESFGLPALEAMTRGVAVVASAWGAGPEVVDGGGRLVDPRDASSFADAVLALLGDASRGARARVAAARFSWDDAADRTLALYRSLRAR